jgi:hypothetical protein
MTGGELSNNGRGGVDVVGGVWSFIGVTMKQNAGFGIYFQGDLPAPGTLTMRGCTVTGDHDAVYLFDEAAADLGTAASPGNNTLQSILGVGLDIDGATVTRIDAVGNTWRAVQGANSEGKYSSSAPPITVSVAGVPGNNYAMAPNNVSLYLSPP